jgi:hypothetical protein
MAGITEGVWSKPATPASRVIRLGDVHLVLRSQDRLAGRELYEDLGQDARVCLIDADSSSAV